MCSYSEISGQIDLALCAILCVYCCLSFLSETGATDIYDTIKSSKEEGRTIAKHLNTIFLPFSQAFTLTNYWN